MPLILAIVADPHEAAQLAALIQGRLAVDLVQATEVGEGLLALDDRIPDLILTSPLMSPFDDGVLDEYLRELGPTGAHVQTLRIPVLSEAPRKKPRLGFSLRRKPKPEARTPEGCEPKVFADEIAQYLSRAAEEKRHAESNETTAVMAREEVTAPTTGEEEWTPAYSSDAAPVYLPDPPATPVKWAAPEPAEEEPSAWRADLLDRPLVEEGLSYDATQTETAPVWEETVSAPASVQELETTEAPSYVVAEPVEIVTELIEPEPQAPVTDVVTRPVVVEHIEEPPIEEPALDEPVEEVRLMPDTTLESVGHDVAFAARQIAGEREDIASVVNQTAIEREDVVSGFSRTPVEDPPIDPQALKATPSFKAALAAIRAAWGKPPRKTDPVDVGTHGNLAAPSAPILAEEDDPADVSAPVEVDLTGAVEMLDEQPPAAAPQPARLQRIAPIGAPPEAADVYELSVESDLSELESQLLTPLPPQPRRDTPSAPPPVAPPTVDSKPRGDRPPVEASSDRRKKSSKQRAKAAKAKPAPPPPQPPEAVQDEWGIFDPNRCGFAALVDKLDKVADKKVEQPRNGNKVRVISYS